MEWPWRHLPRAAVTVPVEPERAGYVTAIDVRAVGLVVLSLGGGRTRADQAIDYAVGLSKMAAIGAEVGPGRPLALIHARNRTDAEQALAALQSAVKLTDERPESTSTVLERLSEGSS